MYCNTISVIVVWYALHIFKCPGFLKLGSQYVCVCVSPPPGYYKPFTFQITNQTSPTAFQFLYTTLAIDITDGHGLSNKARHEFLPKEEQGNTVFAVHFTVKVI